MNENLYYQVSGSNWKLQFAPQVTSLLLNHAQTGRNTKESVGQLYTTDLTKSVVYVEHATCLAPKLASWSRVKFDTKKALSEREYLFEQGLHCVGIWHTHPESIPTPSGEDRRLSRDYARAAIPHLEGIVFVIIGSLALPDGFRVWVDDGKKLHPASHISFLSSTDLPS